MAEHDPVARIMALADDYADSKFDVLERDMNGTRAEFAGATAYVPVARSALETAIRAEVGRGVAACAVVETAGALFDLLPSTGQPYDDLADQLAEDLDAFAALAPPSDGGE